jgi:poly(3-hydroxybutyrate) depolymerase
MRNRAGIQATAVACAALAFGMMAVAAERTSNPQKLTFGSGGVNRTYYLFVPDNTAAGHAPLLLLLHGSGRNGKSLIDPWLPLAKAEGIVLVAPDASDPRAWRIPQEGPDFFHDLLEMVRITHEAIDDRRMYVFGHSAGAIHGLDLALLESRYFAAAAVHAGVIGPGMMRFVDEAPRKIPIAIWVGTNDAFFPVPAVRATRDALNAHGFNAQLTEIKNHTHDYYGSSGDINRQVWAFLKEHRLTADPQFQEYQLVK